MADGIEEVAVAGGGWGFAAHPRMENTEAMTKLPETLLARPRVATDAVRCLMDVLRHSGRP
jgi:hypothetical protein